MGPEPNLITYCATMSACERASEWEAATLLFSELKGPWMFRCKILHSAIQRVEVLVIDVFI